MEAKRVQERRRNLAYLVAAFLWDQGYSSTADLFAKEAQLVPDIQVCDNIDLETILLEYSEYYYVKYNKYPKLCKKVEQLPGSGNGANITTTRKEKSYRERQAKQDEEGFSTKNKVVQKYSQPAAGDGLDLGMKVTPMFKTANEDNVQNKSVSGETISIHGEKSLRLVKDLYQSGSELREIADIISREIVLTDLNVHWHDIKGLDTCKELLKEATIYPLKYPFLFKGKFDAWKGILLYGPPGTGKTMLAKAIATECKATFFNITSSSIVSKWRGDSEKYVRVLIDLAQHYAPTIIFIDEIDWTTAYTGDCSSSNSEPARRFRAEFLTRLDGLLSASSAHVILLAATNIPWNIDVALLRRLEKRIFVDLPDAESRRAILESYIDYGMHNSTQLQLLIRDTQGFSCADLKLLCKEAWMNQLRPMWKLLENEKPLSLATEVSNQINDIKYLQDAMNYVKPTTKHINTKYKQWSQDFGFLK